MVRLHWAIEGRYFILFSAPNPSGNTTPRGRGRGGGRGGQLSGPNSGTTTPNRGRGRGHDSPRGRGRGQPDFHAGGRRSDIGIGSPRGRGGGGPQRRSDTLSGLLYQERPFLRPIVFVPSVLTKVLFQEDEELLKPGVEEVDDTEQSHIPTADRVFRVFSGGDLPHMESENEDDGEDKEEIEEVDFNDIGKLFNPPDALKTTTTVRKSKLVETTTIVEEQFTGFYVDPNPASSTIVEHLQPVAKHSEGDNHTFAVEKLLQPILSDSVVDDLAKMVDETLSSTNEAPATDDIVMSTPSPANVPLVTTLPQTVDAIVVDSQPDLFYIDTQSAPIPSEKAPTQDLLPGPLQYDDDDDEVIVYVAPHPRRSGAQDEEEKPSASVNNSTTGPDTSRFSPYVRPATLPQIPPIASTSFSGSVPPPSTSTTIPAPPSFSSFSFSFSQSTNVVASGSGSLTPSKSSSSRLTVPPVSTPRQAKAWKKKRGIPLANGKKRGKKGKATSFGAFGAMREEALLHPLVDRRRDERRQGDSDLDWGDSEDDVDGEVDEIDQGLLVLAERKGKEKMKENKENEVIGLEAEATKKDKGKGRARDYGSLFAAASDGEAGHGMDVDPDLASDVDAMKRFVGGLLGPDAGRHVTMDDVRIEDMIRMEDEGVEEEDSEGEDDESSEDEEEEDVLAAEEAMLISESLQFEDDLKGEGLLDSDDDDDDSEDEDMDQTPRTTFQARLERLRNKARSRKVADTSFKDIDDDESDEDKDDFIKRNMTWADEDEDFIQEIQDMLDENEDILTGRDRKQRNALFRSVRNGSFEDMEDFSPAKRKKDKRNGLPAELQAQWDKDRQTKAEHKKARALARLEAAADPLAKNKGGKKGRKAMLAAAKLDPTITVLPNRIIDITTLVQQIRRFIADVGGPMTMSLPPTNKETRKNIHEMATAFNLKSLSKGKGDARYTTLTKTSKSGLAADERKVAKIMRRSGGMGARGDSFIYDKKGKAPASMPRHKEGEEVGKAAPKLNESNIGFRMLAMMGWAEGDRIGFTGGLDVPLTAIIKHTKLGLGATK
ncbi:hypothetical protein GALMADRAFT_257616 [Galerina marginata CBS 339.88]|uniref:Protein SQS1 n=1 Tax=Galerina marginata (strain CBS 339.88) TaxID=685588 RepID=A0A067SA97_GALM3|nr:hypothetical protein GALMADRAFT_257616 [Galerina marginata CBS 339.88]